MDLIFASPNLGRGNSVITATREREQYNLVEYLIYTKR